MPTIDKFRGGYFFLSNFYPEPLFWRGRLYQTAEHAYQAAKAAAPEAAERIAAALTPGAAKRMGRRVVLRNDWEQVKLRTMESILRAKFAPGTECAALLERTGSATLVEGNTWGDVYWGVCNGQGSNYLGILLMLVREENRARARNS